jgi:hypothetical protein
VKAKLTLVFLFVGLASFSQNRNSIWCFGDSAGIDFRDTANPVPIFNGMDGRGSCVSIADTSGDLLFYSWTHAGTAGNTGRIFNRNHLLMQNGDSIVGEAWYGELVIVPMPNQSDKYYLFSIGITGSSQPGLFYSVVDMSLDGGFGGVTQKNIQVVGSFGTQFADCVIAIKHANGRDWWILFKRASPTSNNVFYECLITPNGVTIPATYGYAFNNARDVGFQKIILNNKRNKLMQITAVGLMCEYDFDRCSGIISNPNVIFPEQLSNYNRVFWEGAYSPNDSVFYVTTTWYSFPNDTSRLLQYDLFAPDISASGDTLFEVRYPVHPSAIRLAPDKKIYMTSFYNCECLPNGYPYPDSVRNYVNENLSVINSPNQVGASCNFQPYSFYLGSKRTYVGLPNNPDYSLGTLVGSPCDTITTNVTSQLSTFNSQLSTYPNPTFSNSEITFTYLSQGSATEIIINNIDGKEVARYRLPQWSSTQTVKLPQMARGIYAVRLTGANAAVQKLVVQ